MTHDPSLPDIFQRRESEARSYCRTFPKVFRKAKGSILYDSDGRRYLDFFCGAGALNYGHNDDAIKQALLAYLESDGIVHSLDLATEAKQRFLERFEEVILAPRRLDYKIQFVGPTGANAIEAALKLARKIKGRSNIIAFTNAYHGLSAGALSITANSFYRHESFTNRNNVSFFPYDGYLGAGIDTVGILRRFLEDKSSGVDLPAAVVVETVQAEGGINIARAAWLRDLAALCREHGILLIVDDIQVGCGRTGNFFSFESAGVQPDMVAISKSISAFGLPMSLLLLKPECDCWKPGEHSGTFRGNNLAFVSAAEALTYWKSDGFSRTIHARGKTVSARLQSFVDTYPEICVGSRGVGLIHGLEMASPELGATIAGEVFRSGLVIELCGGKRNVLKFLPALNITSELLNEGLDIIEGCLRGSSEARLLEVDHRGAQSSRTITAKNA